jgi:excisionase family DNA binding protein
MFRLFEKCSLSIIEQIEGFDRALTSKDLVRLLAVSKATISREAAAGRLPCFRIGNSLRFDPKAVVLWLRSR